MKLTTQRLKKLIREELDKMNDQEKGIEYYQDFDANLEFVIDNNEKTITKIDNNIGYGDSDGQKIENYSNDEEFEKAAKEIRDTYDKIKE